MMAAGPLAPASVGSADPVLELQVTGVTKGYIGVQALKGVDLNVRRGSIHALAGQNGAGKSTLVKILSGAEAPDSGSIIFGGQPLHCRSPQDAQDAGIQTIYQELSLIPQLSVAENIFLGSLPRKAFPRIVDWPEMICVRAKRLRESATTSMCAGRLASFRSPSSRRSNWRRLYASVRG